MFRALYLVLALCASGCSVLGVKEQRKSFESFVQVRGEVRTEQPSEGPIIVLLQRVTGAPGDIEPQSNRRPTTLVDHYRVGRNGRFAFAMRPGTYRLAAFLDRDANLVYESGEPVLVGLPDFDMTAGETRDDIELIIPADAHLDLVFDVSAEQARTPRDQVNFSLGRFTARGDVVDLDEPRFGPKSGEMGMWRFVDFLFEIGPGIYFLEEYDPDKIPVLFVHGMSGFPQQFSTLIERIDRESFQPWFYFYPSGVGLDGVSNHLTNLVVELQEQHEFDDIAVVAHSMGGLVARSTVLKYSEQTGRRDITFFAAISSPWGGTPNALGLEDKPQNLIVYSWLDMNPDGKFLKGLFYQPPDFRNARPLPSHTKFHMIYGFKRRSNKSGPSGDGTLTLESMTRIEAVEAADYRALPLNYSHTGILHSDEAVNRLNRLLEESFE